MYGRLLNNSYIHKYTFVSCMMGGKIRFFSSFLDLIFYKTAIWISWQVLSTFPTSAPLVKRFAPRRKIRVFVPSYLASWTCKNYKYRCISHFACTMYLIRKPDRQSCSEKIIKLCDYNLISEVGSPTRINNFLNPAKCLRKKSSQWCWFNTKKENIFFLSSWDYICLYLRIRLLFNDRKMSSQDRSFYPLT